jgi:cation transport regulator ChaC
MQSRQSIKYFAYGSNMPLARLQQRVPSAKLVSPCYIHGYDLRFHMASNDGSAKCNAFESGNTDDCVWGVVFDMLISQRPALDQAESLNVGYSAKLVDVSNDHGEKFEALIYCAIPIDDTFKPYSWYLNHVLMGAIENKLPSNYIDKIKKVESIEDENKERALKEYAIHQ